MTTETSSQEPVDPVLKTAADAFRDAAKQAGDDAAKMKERIRQVGPDVAHSASRFAYTTSYMISYGLVYATVFIAKSLPDNPIVDGFVDGGRAAIDAVNEAKGISPADAHSMPA